MSHVLEGVWENVVMPILAALQLPYKRNEARPRLWWCPTGNFAFLPMHAAGNSSGVCTSDYVVSSYTPSLGALVEARKQRDVSVPPSAARVVLVAQPNVVGNATLPVAAAEVSQLATLHPPEQTIRIDQEVLESPTDRGGRSAAAVTDVYEAIRHASVVHLACHAKQDRGDPMSSGFVLEGGMLTIADIARARMPRAFFAFLREMYDLDGPDVAKEVHEALLNGGYEESSLIPRALDSAVRKLRERGLPPERWATYVHMGI
ncbi:hypothetical protein PUNSTDRAFT_135030 [Punctularia strigosozonata HHB-11173 SS5]|uniref:uncharacterized protein n=1 Tax=Punctularia strigosozonata (strain HHB-11173) TaxID=741275 RepID=UPI000441746F|nr:uncharacterized protein PUNSTDRAFT_135030 [Punctularia strigosozonata HHB-11173 SS5]EIN08653.1 hypothetical protein PUNSTDRAFT_135030 [Punctularia strigosozonata HHB-11173 SS5]